MKQNIVYVGLNVDDWSCSVMVDISEKREDAGRSKAFGPKAQQALTPSSPFYA